MERSSGLLIQDRRTVTPVAEAKLEGTHVLRLIRQCLPNDRDEVWVMRRFLDHGIAIAGVEVGESHGNPAGRAVHRVLHRQLVEKYKAGRKACFLSRSRGGLMLYGWAAERRSTFGMWL